MFDLPLFPLNTVLFPGTPLRLRIFEDRYKRMISLCIQDKSPFGVVLIRSGVEALGPLAKPYMIGCTAQIIQVRPLGEGRMDIVAVGQERFRILSLQTNVEPYLIGTVEAYPLANPQPGVVRKNGQVLRRMVLRYLTILVEAGASQFDRESLPEDPVELAYMASSLVQLDPHKKYELLAAGSAADLVSSVYAIYRREVALLKPLLRVTVSDKGVFSNN